jgi:hypothetical protein
MPAFSNLLSSADVEAIFGRTDRTIRTWAKKGYLRRIKVGNSVFYSPENVNSLVSSGLTGAILDGSGSSE